MITMTLGGQTLSKLPSDMTLITPDRISAMKKTYSNVAFFSWGNTLVGKVLELKWPLLSFAEFDVLDTLFQADSSVVFDPGVPSPTDTYTVEIIALDGKYYMQTTRRTNVRMKLLILAVI